ncbi:hypothetical protein, partial [Sinorhizobium meliloti]|uniref:hypothetical protein n=1 Tax=Rhizobium meliloti TaxID=382 RepID=UPI001F428134
SPGLARTKSAFYAIIPNTCCLWMGTRLAVAVRRRQQAALEQRPKKYAIIMHNDTQRAAHTWQRETKNQTLQKLLNTACNKRPASYYFLNRTPTPPPFSGMNSIPALANAATMLARLLTMGT